MPYDVGMPTPMMTQEDPTDHKTITTWETICNTSPWSLMQLNQAHQEPATDAGRQDISKGIVEANTYGRAIPSREEEEVDQEYFTILEESELPTSQNKIKNKTYTRNRERRCGRILYKPEGIRATTMDEKPDIHQKHTAQANTMIKRIDRLAQDKSINENDKDF